MEKIFYYRHTNNEIYELKFKKVLISLGGKRHDINNKKFDVLYVEVEVAGLGVLTWAKYGYSNTLRVSYIFDTIEKAIRCYNNSTLGFNEKIKMGLREEDVFHVKVGFSWDCSAFDTNFNIPSHIFEVQGVNIVGQPTIDYYTWVWDGITAKERGCLGCPKPQTGVPNSYKNLIYDLVGKECIYDKSIVGYATREECVRANCIKIHCFE